MKIKQATERARQSLEAVMQKQVIHQVTEKKDAIEAAPSELPEA
jgi:hypothetical protein